MISIIGQIWGLTLLLCICSALLGTVYSKRLESYSPDELLERREFLINALQEEDNESEEDTGASRTSMLLELSIVEQLLIALGILMIDDITSGTDPQDPTPPPPPPP